MAESRERLRAIVRKCRRKSEKGKTRPRLAGVVGGGEGDIKKKKGATRCCIRDRMLMPRSAVHFRPERKCLKIILPPKLNGVRGGEGRGSRGAVIALPTSRIN
jgi:hypothetical protein